MALELVPAKPEHVDEMGRICYEAFKDIHDRHGFPTDFPSTAFARQIFGMLVQREDYYAVAALMDGQPVGSNFMSLTDSAGVQEYYLYDGLAPRRARPTPAATQ